MHTKALMPELVKNVIRWHMAAPRNSDSFSECDATHAKSTSTVRIQDRVAVLPACKMVKRSVRCLATIGAGMRILATVILLVAGMTRRSAIASSLL